MAWLSGWDYRIEIKIEDYAGDIGAEVSHFPVTIFLTATQCEEVFVELTTDAEYNKVAITKADGITELYGDNELFDVSEKLGIYHVSRAGWTINANTSIFLYYDKDHAENDTYISKSGDTAAESVWNSDFKVIYHMAGLLDSTSNNKDLTKTGTVNFVDAKVYKGASATWDLDNDLTRAAVLGGNIGEGDITIEAIFLKDGAATNDYTPAIVCVGKGGDPDNKRIVLSASKDNGYLGLSTYDGDYSSVVSTTVISNNAHHYIVGTRDGTLLEVFVDGVSVGDDTLTVRNVTEDMLTFGNTGIEAYDYIGAAIISEVRISTVIRPDAWIKGTYNSLWDTLLTYGSEETEAVEVNALFFGSNF